MKREKEAKPKVIGKEKTSATTILLCTTTTALVNYWIIIHN